MARIFPRKIKRVVVKLGSSVIATDRMKPRISHLRSLIGQISDIQNKGVEVILVSSGAIVLGMGELGLTQRPKDLAMLQTLSAIGQTQLMRRLSDLFKSKKTRSAQILLTWDDFDNRSRFNNARSALETMLGKKIVPVINENDSIATDEIKFGDNDKLSALVASQMRADVLILLSDVEGFYDTSEPKKKVVEQVRKITREVEGWAGGSARKNFSKGGMTAKLEAIKIATSANIPCVIANGLTDDVLVRILKNERIGTLFSEKEEKFLARKHWISFGAKPKGSLIIDAGAKTALLKGGVSLLVPGIVRWEGHFRQNDVVVIRDEHRQEIGRGIIRYSNEELARVEEKKGLPEAIHCDELVLSER